ncbi:MAG: dimethylsulfonioproprionate lyase family protein [Ardenticatenaceae bacterium]
MVNPDSESVVLALVSAMRGYLDGVNCSRLGAFLEEWPQEGGASRVVSPCRLPVLAWMAEMVEAASTETEALVAQLAASVDYLAWGQTYSSNDFGVAFLERYGWTELIGQRGPIASEQIACGFLLLGPELEYPLHSHEAEEIYVPLTEKTLWMRGQEGWTRRPAGLPIHHASWTPHAMRTDTSPLLALYLWRGGNLTQKSRID